MAFGETFDVKKTLLRGIPERRIAAADVSSFRYTIAESTCYRS